MIEIRNDSRIISLPSEPNSEQVVWINESAIFEGFTNGSWSETGDIRLQQNNLLRVEEEINILSATPFESEEITNIMGDNNEYIASRYGSYINLFTNLENLTIRGLRSILELLGFEGISDVEYFSKKLENMILVSNKKTVEQSKRRMGEIEVQQQTSFNQYISLSNERLELERTLQGMESFDGELSTKCLDQIQKLFRSRYVDSVEFLGGKLVVTTEPLKLAIWDIGAFEITFDPHKGKPNIQRLQYPAGSERVVADDGRSIDLNQKQHPHVSSGSPCTGNYAEQFRAFWDRDMLYGFNLVIRYLRSYNSRNPYMHLEPFLKTMGYIHDAEILDNHKAEGEKLTFIDDGDIYIGGSTEEHELKSEEFLREWGCTGEMETDPDVLEDVWVTLRQRSANESILHSVDYIRAEEPEGGNVVEEPEVEVVQVNEAEEPEPQEEEQEVEQDNAGEANMAEAEE